MKIKLLAVALGLTFASLSQADSVTNTVLLNGSYKNPICGNFVTVFQGYGTTVQTLACGGTHAATKVTNSNGCTINPAPEVVDGDTTTTHTFSGTCWSPNLVRTVTVKDSVPIIVYATPSFSYPGCGWQPLTVVTGVNISQFKCGANVLATRTITSFYGTTSCAVAASPGYIVTPPAPNNCHNYTVTNDPDA